MKKVELNARVRHAVQMQGLSCRAAAEQFGIDPQTVAKMLRFLVPPGYVRAKPPIRPKLDAFTGVIDAIMATERTGPRSSDIHPSGNSSGCVTSTAVAKWHGKVATVHLLTADRRQRRTRPGQSQLALRSRIFLAL